MGRAFKSWGLELGALIWEVGILSVPGLRTNHTYRIAGKHGRCDYFIALLW